MASEREKQYLDEVCSHVKWRQAHGNIRTELSQHMEELREAKLSEGMSEEQASAETVLEMGDSELVGVSMNQAYRPRVSMNMLGLLMILVVLGVIVRCNTFYMHGKEIFSLVFGAGMFYVTVRWLDLRWLMDHSGKIALCFGILSAAICVAVYVLDDGDHYLSLEYLQRMNLCVGLLQPIATVLMIRDQRGKGIFGLIKIGVFCILTILPLVVLKRFGISMFIALLDIVLIMISILKKELGRNRLALTLILAGSVVVLGCVVYCSLGSDYIRRLSDVAEYSSFYREDVIYYGESVLKYCKFIGSAEFPFYYPDLSFLHSGEMVVDYLLVGLAVKYGTWVYWIAGILMCAMLALMIRWSLRQRCQLVKMIGIAVTGVFFMQILFYFMSNLGLYFWGSISLPFLSSGNMIFITNFALMGILFSAAGSGWLYEEGKENNKKSKVAV